MLRPFFSLIYRSGGITTKNTKSTKVRKILFVLFVVKNLLRYP